MILSFVFGVLLGILAFVLLLVMWPKTAKRCDVPENKSIDDMESSAVESVNWLNFVIQKVYKKIDLHENLLKFLQDAVKDAFNDNKDSAIKRLDILDAKISKVPPVFSNVVTNINQGNVEGVFMLIFPCELELSISTIISIPILGNKQMEGTVKVHSITGHVSATVPYEKGSIVIKLKNETDIDMDFNLAFVNGISIDTESVPFVWKLLKNFALFVAGFVKIQIPIIPEENESEGDPISDSPSAEGNLSDCGNDA